MALIKSCFMLRYSGRTEYQSTHHNKPRRSVQLERRPSQRYGRRQSHVLRERQKMQAQEVEKNGIQSGSTRNSERSTNSSTMTKDIEPILCSKVNEDLKPPMSPTISGPESLGGLSQNSKFEKESIGHNSFGKSSIGCGSSDR